MWVSILPSPSWLLSVISPDIPELEGTAPSPSQESAPSDVDIYEWLVQRHSQSRGLELGTFNISLLATAMNQQSAKWPRFALGYIGDIFTVVHQYILKSLQLVCADKRVARNLLAEIFEKLIHHYQRAVDQVTFLLSVERNGIPTTLNHYFNDNLQKW